MPLNKFRVVSTTDDATTDAVVTPNADGLRGNAVLLLSHCIKKLADL